MEPNNDKPRQSSDQLPPAQSEDAKPRQDSENDASTDDQGQPDSETKTSEDCEIERQDESGNMMAGNVIAQRIKECLLKDAIRENSAKHAVETHASLPKCQPEQEREKDEEGTVGGNADVSSPITAPKTAAEGLEAGGGDEKQTEGERENGLDEKSMELKPDERGSSKVTNVDNMQNAEVKHTGSEVSDTVQDKDVETSKKVPNNESEKPSLPQEEAGAILDEESEVSLSTGTMDTMSKVLQGCCAFEDLPPLNKKVVRIFVSSTFSDTKEERNALMENVYPKIAEYCREKYGLEFQVVDMRWGVPEHAADNHSTTELCLQEVKKCQDVSVGPNFVSLLGNKYGYRPIPSSIPQEEFDALATVAKESDYGNWKVVEEWYSLDENSQPPVYLLLPISSRLKDYNNTENAELRKQARNEWNSIDAALTSGLRHIASLAESQKKISPQQRHKYFMSVTESEVAQGLLDASTDPTDSCLCIVRKIPDIKEHLQDTKAPKFIDIADQSVDKDAEKLLEELIETKVSLKVPSGNLTKVEIEWTASGGKLSLESLDNIDIEQYAQQFPDTELAKTQVVKHKEYLEGICQDFSEKILAMINKGGERSKQVYGELTTEVVQHQHFAKLRCEVFEGRKEVLGTVKAYLGSNASMPLTIHGESGCGKTSVIAKVFHELQTWARNAKGETKPIVCLLRFLGTTPLTSNLQDLLESLCQQIAKLYGKKWEQPDRFSDLVKDFHRLLTCASREKPLLILLDSIDQLLPAYNAYKMKWLPDKLPSFVKIIISTIDDRYPVVEAMKERYGHTDNLFIEIKPLGQQVGMEIILKWLHKNNRRISEEQTNLVSKALESCSLPLYARIIFDQINRWKSFDDLSTLRLESTIKGAINKHFQYMETKLGTPLVKHSLAYLTAARFGVSEVEMEHLLSLDDELLNKIYQFWKPPVRRIPPLLWTRVRSEINSYVVERSADDILVLQWYHRQFTETTKERYLKQQDFKMYIHKNLADYFSGVWGGGKPKPFEYTESQKARFCLQETKSLADRKVPSQPYFTQASTDGHRGLRINQRKLSELPLHLLKSHQLDTLKKDIFFNYKWLYAKLKCNSAQSILQEIEFFMAADAKLRKDSEMKILYATFQLIRPYITKFPESLPLELVGRLAKHVGSSPLLTSLIKHCDTHGVLTCPVVPILTCFETADLGLKQNINFRSSEPWHKGGTLTCTKNFQTMYLIDYDDQGVSHLSAWDIESGERIFENPLVKVRDQEASDVYFQCVLDKSEEHLIALYRKKYYEGLCRRPYSGDGFIDIIRIEDATVVRTIQEFLYKYEFTNSVLYLTENWIAVRFGWKIPLWNLKEDNKIQLTQPHILSQDETKFILTRSKKSGVRYYEGEDKVVTEARTKSAGIREFATKEDIGEFEKSDNMAGVAFSSDELTVLLADAVGCVNVYDISRLGKGKVLKPKKTLTLPRNEKVRIVETLKTDEEQQSCRTTLVLSANDDYVIGVYQSSTEWEALLWNVNTAKFINRIADAQPVLSKYPSFSHDSQNIVLCVGTKVLLLSSTTGKVVMEYEQNQLIRDIYVSTVTPQMAVMKGKDATFLSTSPDAVKPEETRREKQSKKNPRDVNPEKVVTLILDEQITNHTVYPPINLNLETMSVTEEVGFFETADLDLLNSARGQRKSALDTWTTPDGSKVVQLHLRLQAVDTKHEEVKYSPKASDVILRAKTSDAGVISNEQLEMPSLHGGFKSLELFEGDRIVGEGNKVRLRVTKDVQGSLKIMTTPSVLVISEHKDGKLKRLHRITTYQEGIQTVSRKFVATSKKTSSGEYVNVYDIEGGKLVTTHNVDGSTACVRISRTDSRLFVVTSNLTFRSYTGFMFLTPEVKITLLPSVGESKQMYVVRDIMDFPLCTEGVVVRYAEEGAVGYALNHYIHVDLTSKRRSPPLTVKPALEDISKDGQLGIDGQLSLHNLQTAQVIRQIVYPNRGINMQLQVRLADDNKHIVFIDKQDDTLHVVRLEGEAVHHIVSCCTHAPQMPSVGGIILRQSGRMIVTYSGNNRIRGLFLLCESEVSNQDSPVKTDYSSETDRAKSMIPLRRPEILHKAEPLATSLEQPALGRIKQASFAQENADSAKP